jgi:tRNA (guanine-N7-)-methyltransferase
MKRTYGDILLAPSVEGDAFHFPAFPGTKAVVEIGFGNGEFLMRLGEEYPENPVVGVEISLACIHKALKRIRQQEVRNVYLLHGDVRFLLGECFSGEGVEAIYMNYPCPWPKQKHSKRRVTTRRFADVLAGVLVTKGVFSFVSDEGWYAEEVRSRLGAHPALESGEVLQELPDHLETKYGRKWRDLGKKSYMVQVRKCSPWLHEKQSSKEAAMHSRFEGVLPLTYSEVLQSFTGASGENGSGGWTLKEVFRGPEGELLLLIISYDEGYQQRFYLRLVPREGETLLKFDPATVPCRTPSVLQAFEEVGNLFKENLGRSTAS